MYTYEKEKVQMGEKQIDKKGDNERPEVSLTVTEYG